MYYFVALTFYRSKAANSLCFWRQVQHPLSGMQQLLLSRLATSHPAQHDACSRCSKCWPNEAFRLNTHRSLSAGQHQCAACLSVCLKRPSVQSHR